MKIAVQTLISKAQLLLKDLEGTRERAIRDFSRDVAKWKKGAAKAFAAEVAKVDATAMVKRARSGRRKYGFQEQERFNSPTPPAMPGRINDIDRWIEMLEQHISFLSLASEDEVNSRDSDVRGIIQNLEDIKTRMEQ